MNKAAKIDTMQPKKHIYVKIRYILVIKAFNTHVGEKSFVPFVNVFLRYLSQPELNYRENNKSGRLLKRHCCGQQPTGTDKRK